MSATVILTDEQVASIIAQAHGSPPPVVVPTPPIPLPVPDPPSSGVAIVDMGWGNHRVIVQELPVALKFTTGNISSTGSLPFIAGAELGSAPSPMQAVLSETPGDFDHPVGGVAGSISGPSNSISIKFALGTGSGFGYYAVLELNKTYYVNVRNAPGVTAGQRFFDLSVNSL